MLIGKFSGTLAAQMPYSTQSAFHRFPQPVHLLRFLTLTSLSVPSEHLRGQCVEIIVSSNFAPNADKSPSPWYSRYTSGWKIEPDLGIPLRRC